VFETAARGVDNGREAVGPVMAVAREAADAQAIPAHHQPVAVMLDLMNPERAGRWPRRLDHGRRINRQPGGLTALSSASSVMGGRATAVRPWRMDRLNLILCR
jgi:hypothetical protein